MDSERNIHSTRPNTYTTGLLIMLIMPITSAHICSPFNVYCTEAAKKWKSHSRVFKTVTSPGNKKSSGRGRREIRNHFYIYIHSIYFIMFNYHSFVFIQIYLEAQTILIGDVLQAFTLAPIRCLYEQLQLIA